MHETSIARICRRFVSLCSPLLLITICASATADDAQVTGSTSRPVTIVMLGDSITKGVRTGVTAEQTFAALVEKGC